MELKSSVEVGVSRDLAVQIVPGRRGVGRLAEYLASLGTSLHLSACTTHRLRKEWAEIKK